MDYFKKSYRELSENQNLLNSSRFVYQDAPKAEPVQPPQTPEAEQVNLSPEYRKRLDDITEKLIAEGKVIDINRKMAEIKNEFRLNDNQWNKVEPMVKGKLVEALRTIARRSIDEATRKAAEAAAGKIETDPGFLGKITTKLMGLPEDIRKMIGGFLVGILVKQKKEGKESWYTSFIEKIAKGLGAETPQDKFEKAKTEVKLPEGHTPGETAASGTEADVNKNGTPVGKLSLNPNTGWLTLTIGSDRLKGKDLAELNKNIQDKYKSSPASAQKPAETQTPAKPAETQETDYADIFSKKGWQLEASMKAQDLETLKKSGITDVKKLIDEAAVDGSKFSQISKAIGTPKGEVFKYRLADLLFQKLSDDNLKIVLAVIKNADGYTLEKTPAKIREFLDKVNTTETDKLAGVFDTFKKKA